MINILGGDDGSLATGNAGPRFACGVILAVPERKGTKTNFIINNETSLRRDLYSEAINLMPNSSIRQARYFV